MTVDVILVDEGDRMKYFVFGTHPELSNKTFQAFDHCSLERVWDCVMDQLLNHVNGYYHRQEHCETDAFPRISTKTWVVKIDITIITTL